MTSKGRRDGTSTAGPGSSDDDRQGGEERGRRWLGRRSTGDRGDLTGTTMLRGGTTSRGWSDGSSTVGPRFNDEDRREREERCLRQQGRCPADDRGDLERRPHAREEEGARGVHRRSNNPGKRKGWWRRLGGGEEAAAW
jgi:hypothetical protein